MVLKVLRICDSEYATKIQKALLIKTHNLQLNRQLYAKNSSFLLNVYQVSMYYALCVYVFSSSFFFSSDF